MGPRVPSPTHRTEDAGKVHAFSPGRTVDTQHEPKKQPREREEVQERLWHQT